MPNLQPNNFFAKLGDGLKLMERKITLTEAGASQVNTDEHVAVLDESLGATRGKEIPFAGYAVPTGNRFLNLQISPFMHEKSPLE